MRNLLVVALLSASFLACGGEGTGVPAVPSADLPEAGAPATPATPATPAVTAPDAGAAKK